MSKGNTTENDVLEHLFKATALSWAANANLYIALHTGDPGEGGNQTTSEATYTSGEFSLGLCRPLLTLPMTTIGVASERDLLNQVPREN